MMKRSLLSALLLLAPALAFGQSTVIQGGSFTAGHVPQYNTSSGQPTVRDGGTAAGTTASGGNPSTLGLTSRCSNPPCDGASSSQGGPNGENFAIFDGPTGDADGYHYLGFSANVGGKAVITTGAGGGAAAQGLDFIIDGTTYNFPGDFPQIPVEVTQGGTGRTSLTAYNLLVGDGTNDVGLIAPSATSGVPLVSQGSSANPAYGTAAIAGGGTGATTATGALNNLLPAQTGQNGKILQTDGSNANWVNVPGTGTVTSVTFSNGLDADINPCVAACTASLANIADDRMLANVSGSSGVPTATTNSAWMDATVGSAQGSLVTRGAATWGALTPGTNGYALLSQGPGADLVFGQYLINNLAIASQAQGDVLYFNGTNWTRLGAGTSGQALVTGGPAANPSWANYNINNLTIASQAQGDIIYRNGSTWTRLPAGTSGQYLQTQGAGANPQWATAPTVTSWVTYTPTFTGFGTVSAVSIWSRRVGDTLEIRGKFTTGTTTGVEAQMTMGFNGTNNNVTSDATKVASIQLAGTAVQTATGVAGSFSTLIESSVGYITFGLTNSGSGGLNKSTGSALYGAGVTVSILAQVPISGW